MAQRTAVVAERLKQLLVDSSPLIETYTRAVCPECRDVCCKQRHGLFLERDLVYLHALNLDVPTRNEARPSDGPCQFIGPAGCTRPRWLRPFKCTWYLCGPLLAAMEESPPKENRHIIALLSEMVRLYDELLEK